MIAVSSAVVSGLTYSNSYELDRVDYSVDFSQTRLQIAHPSIAGVSIASLPSHRAHISDPSVRTKKTAEMMAVIADAQSGR